MRTNKPLQKEGSFKEFSENRSRVNSPGGRDRKRDKKSSRTTTREFFDAVCSKCKKNCKVPFKPTSGKPVSCSNCFERQGNFGNSKRGDRKSFGDRDNNHPFGRGDNNRGDREMFDAVCSKCKKKCSVPFKPTSGKPVSCSNCFVKRDSPRGGRQSFGGQRDNFRRGNDSRRRDSRGPGRRDSRGLGRDRKSFNKGRR